MKTKLITIIFLLLQLPVAAQNNDINHRKYWYYRSRLCNDFMKVGNQQGESLPMSHRAIYGDSYGTSNGSLFVGGDATSQLGWYACVLATEYKLLKDNSTDPHVADSTLRELYYALEAFNRLDYTAESLWGNANALDGFFLRQDVPQNFVTSRLNHFNYELNLLPANASNTEKLNAKGFCSTSHNIDLIKDLTGKYDDSYPRWQDNPTDAFNRNSLAMSLDQTIGMFNACALINKFFPASETYNDANGNAIAFLDGEVSIKGEARKISERMKNALQGGGDWRILMPGGQHVDSWQPGNDNGGNAFPYCFAFSEADCKIQNANTPLSSALPCLGEQNIISGTLGFVTWEGLTSNVGVIADAAHRDNAPKTVGLEMACNCAHEKSWSQVFQYFIESVISYIIGWIEYFTGETTTTPVYNWQWAVGNATKDLIENRAGLFDLEYAPLMRHVIHGGGNLRYLLFNYLNFLNDAPCEGPRYYNGASNNPSAARWTSRDNLEHPEEVAGTIKANGSNGEYNGLDYMLYHNLYYIDNPSTYPSDNRYKNIAIAMPFISGTNYIGSNATPLKVPALEYINANNSINAINPSLANDPSNGNVSYRAGKVVSLKPGFSAKEGSTFRGYIQRFNCESDNDVHRLIGQGNTEQNAGYSETNFDVLPTTQPKKQKINVDEVEDIPLTKRSEIKKSTIPKKQNQSNTINIYPNPSNGLFNINMDIKTVSNIVITVTDLLNKEVLKQNINTNNTKQFELDLRNFTKGVYLVGFNFGNGNSMVQKLIIQ